MLGYKAAKSGDTRVLITLEIPEDALTNMARSSVVIRETAKHRTNRAKVLKIEDEKGVSYPSASSAMFPTKEMTYRMGEMVEEPSYTLNSEDVCGEGIHFFLSRKVAELYGLNKVQNGFWQAWHENGRQAAEATFVDGKAQGTYRSWHPDGTKLAEMSFVDGIMHSSVYSPWFDK
jgi:hypothetical protein